MKEKKNPTLNPNRHSKLTRSKRHISRMQPRFNPPIELLQLIIRMAHPVDVSFDMLEEYPNKDRLGNILALSLVSRFWRHAIVNDPTTWSVVNLPSPQSQLQEQISRSGRVPLHIFVHLGLFSPDEDISRYIIAFNELHRVKTLFIPDPFDLTPSEDLCSALLSLMPQCAPMLETLDITSCGFSYGFKFLSGGAPQLKEVSIGHAIFSLPLSAFGGLTVLTASMWDSFSSKALTDILLAAPLLEFLSLICWSEDLHPEYSRLIPLSNLKTLILHGNHDLISKFLSSFIIPPNISWQFHIVDYRAPIQSLTSIISTAAPTEVCIDINTYDSDITLRQSSYDTPSGLSSDCIGISPWGVGDGVVPHVNDILSTLDLSRVTIIRLSVPFDALPHKLATRDIYRTLVNLRILEIHYWGNVRSEKVPKFERAYLDGLMCPVKSNGHKLRTVPCPLLEKLEIVKPRVSWRGYAASVKACIKARRIAGCPFKRVILRDAILVEVTQPATSNVRTVLRGLVEWKRSGYEGLCIL